MRDDPAEEMLAMRVPLHFLMRFGIRFWSRLHPDGALHNRSRVLLAAVATSDAVQGLLLMRGWPRGRRDRILRGAADTFDVAAMIYLAGPTGGNVPMVNAIQLALPAVIEGAYRRGARGIGACIPLVVGTGLGGLTSRSWQRAPSLVWFPILTFSGGWALRWFEAWELRERERLEEQWRGAVEEDAFASGRLEFIRKDSDGGQLLDLQGHALNFLANVDGGRRQSNDLGPKEMKAIPTPGLPQAALLRGALHLHQLRRQPLRPSPADTLIPMVAAEDQLVLFDGDQLRRLEGFLLRYQPAGVTVVSVVDRTFLGRGTSYRLRIQALRSLDNGPPVDVEVDVPSSRGWRFDFVAFGLAWQAVFTLGDTFQEGYVPFSVTLPLAAALLVGAGVAERTIRLDGSGWAPSLSLMGFGPAFVMATVGGRQAAAAYKPGGSLYYPGIRSLQAILGPIGFQFVHMRALQIYATIGSTLMCGWLSWRNSPLPRSPQSFLTECAWGAVGFAAAPFVRRAFNTRGDRYAAELAAATSRAADRGRTLGWSAMVSEAWRFQIEAERLAAQAQPTDSYQRLFLDRAWEKLESSRRLLIQSGGDV